MPATHCTSTSAALINEQHHLPQGYRSCDLNAPVASDCVTEAGRSAQCYACEDLQQYGFAACNTTPKDGQPCTPPDASKKGKCQWGTCWAYTKCDATAVLATECATQGLQSAECFSCVHSSTLNDDACDYQPKENQPCTPADPSKKGTCHYGNCYVRWLLEAQACMAHMRALPGSRLPHNHELPHLRFATPDLGMCMLVIGCNSCPAH